MLLQKVIKFSKVDQFSMRISTLKIGFYRRMIVLTVKFDFFLTKLGISNFFESENNFVRWSMQRLIIGVANVLSIIDFFLLGILCAGR